MLDELIQELSMLCELKKKLEYAMADKQTLSDNLYLYMRREYETTPYEQRVIKYQKDTCSDCRHYENCNLVLPDNILEPIPSDKGWVPALRSCGKFVWS